MLEAKLQMPAISKTVISREKSLQKLRHVPQSKLTLVVAPAGYGKTTAVLHWLEQCGLPSAWLSLDARDNSPGVFWQYVCAALDRIVEGVSRETEYVFSSREMMQANIHINTLIDRLAMVESDFVLVLDDLHSITDPSIMEGLSYLIDYLPAPMHLVFISRTAPDMELPRHRVRWQGQRVGEQDLRFDKAEIASFYRARGIALEVGEIRRIMSHTEGWAAALVALAMSVEENPQGRDVMAGLAASGKDIGQYLNNEVLRTWSAEKQEFAVKTCILDTLSEEVCDAVTGGGNAGWMLAEIHEGSGFLFALDEQLQAYRYHQLFKDFLHKLLSQRVPEETALLHIRAGRWFRSQGQMPEAIGHLLEGGAHDEALELIEHRIDDLIRKNDFDRVLPWVERLPQDYRNNSFRIATIYALYYAEANRLALSRQWLERMKALCQERERGADTRQNSRAKAHCALAEANLLMREGNVGFLPLLFAAAENGAGEIPAYNDFNVADIYFCRCPINVLIKVFREAPEKYARMTRCYREMFSQSPGYAPLAVGEYHYEGNRPDQALPYLLQALEEARAAACPGALIPSVVNIARIKRAEGDLPGALEVLEECGRNLQGMGKIHWNYSIQAFLCKLRMDMGDGAYVGEWFASRKLSVFTELSKAREFELIVYARALMFKGRPKDAKLLLQRLLSFAQKAARTHSQVEILSLLALLALGSNEMPDSVACLECALAIGMEEGYLRSFLDEFPPMGRLLRYYTAPRRTQAGRSRNQALLAYAKSILRQAPSAPEAQTAQGMEKLLTAQETKVLKLLLKANTNSEIAESLGISIRTVKTHTGNIYGKLGVKSRAQCVKLAREAALTD